MSSHQRRVYKRYHTCLTTLAFLVWVRRQALRILRLIRKWGVVQPILSDTDWCAAVIAGCAVATGAAFGAAW